MDLSTVFEHSLCGQMDKKFDLFGDILYEECKARFGILTSSRGKGWKETETESLMQTLLLLPGRWRKSSSEERAGQKMLWDDVKLKLAYMQKAEHFHRYRERKEKERSSFLRNPSVGCKLDEEGLVGKKGHEKEQKAMVMEEVTNAQQEQYKTKAMSQGQQGTWTTREGTLNRLVNW